MRELRATRCMRQLRFSHVFPCFPLPRNRSRAAIAREYDSMIRLLLCALLFVGLAGCDLFGDDDRAPTNPFEVTLRGEVNDAFRGTATFDSLKSTAILIPPVSKPPTFEVSLDDDRRTDDRYLFFSRKGRTRPPVGTYTFGSYADLLVRDDIFVTTVHLPGLPVLGATQGVLHIDESTDARVTGTFAFDAAPLANQDASEDTMDLRVRVTGTFQATPQSYRDVFGVEGA